jgi:hypothetical protein
MVWFSSMSSMTTTSMSSVLDRNLCGPESKVRRRKQDECPCRIGSRLSQPGDGRAEAG